MHAEKKRYTFNLITVTPHIRSSLGNIGKMEMWKKTT